MVETMKEIGNTPITLFSKEIDNMTLSSKDKEYMQSIISEKSSRLEREFSRNDSKSSYNNETLSEPY